MRATRLQLSLALLLLTTACAIAQPVEAVLGVTIPVADLDRAMAFYTRELDFEVVGRGQRTVDLRLGRDDLWAWVTRLRSASAPGRSLQDPDGHRIATFP